MNPPFIPKIFDRSQEVLIPDGFNSVKLSLDGSMQSDLNWKEAIELARHFQSQGLYLFWEISLGLFSSLTFPLSHSSQHLALKLSLEHFRELIWNEFREKTIGLSLYRGSADFSADFPWDEEQRSNFQEWKKEKNLDEEQLIRFFCRNAAIEYLNLLARDLPDGLMPFLLLDAAPFPDAWIYTQLIHAEIFDHFQLMVKNSPYPCTTYSWEKGNYINGCIGASNTEFHEIPLPKVGVCLPSHESICYKKQLVLQEAFKNLVEKRCFFRVIPEMFLTSEWNELDYLLVDLETLSYEGKRKLQGFNAAGGIIIPLVGDNDVDIQQLSSYSKIEGIGKGSL
jgi:hypothetical protein